MAWLQSIDLSWFKFVNQTLGNPFFDWLMPILSGNVLFVPAVIVALLLLLWKGGIRGRLCVLLLVITVAVADGLAANSLKDWIKRPRPFYDVPETVLRAGRGRNDSMPSAHAVNMFAAATVLALYYRRSLAIMLPLAAMVGVSRVYLGVHYPGDVICGALVGVVVALLTAWLANAFWRIIGRRWFAHAWAGQPFVCDGAAWLRGKPHDNPPASKDA